MNIEYIEKQDKISFKNVVVFREILEDWFFPTPDINDGKTIVITFISGDYDGIIKNDNEWIVYHTGRIGCYREHYHYNPENHLIIALFKEPEYISSHDCPHSSHEVWDVYINGVIIKN